MDDYQDIIYTKEGGVAKVSINRPRVLNAFRPLTIDEMRDAFQDAWNDIQVGVVVLTGENGNFCTGGDVKTRGEGGYQDEGGGVRLQVTHLHRLIREIPKPVIAMVDGYAIGGGHVLHVLCDLTIASDRAVFGQIGPKFGSFDAGFGAIYLARIVGEKKAREIWYLCRRYPAQEALQMGLVNAVVPQSELESTVMEWSREAVGEESHRTEVPQARLQCGHRPRLRHTEPGPRRYRPLLHHGRMQGRQQRLFGEARSRLQQLSPSSLVGIKKWCKELRRPFLYGASWMPGTEHRAPSPCPHP